MAGAGYKTFNTGDVLTASDVNTYLMQQTTMVFADASARTTALGANVAEGMISYLKDTNAVERYDGSSWGAIGAGDIEGVTAGAGLSGGGTSGTVTLNLASTAAGRNAIINGGFDIWQRGTSFSSPNAIYVADRWKAEGSTPACTISRQATGDTTNLPNIQYGLRFQRNSGQTNTSAVYLYTGVETANAIPFAGKSVVVSFYAKAGANYSSASSALSYFLNTGTGTDENPTGSYTGNVSVASGSVTLTTSYQRFSFTANIGSTATEFKLGFNYTPTGTAGANDWFEVTGVQLELGSSATPFSRAGGTIQGELAACQRYYVRWGGLNTNQNFGQGFADQTTTAMIQVPFPVTMRTVASSIDFSTLNLTTGGTNTAVTNCTLLGNNQSNQMALAYATVAAGLTTNRPYGLTANNSLNGYIGFSAEL